VVGGKRDGDHPPTGGGQVGTVQIDVRYGGKGEVVEVAGGGAGGNPKKTRNRKKVGTGEDWRLKEKKQERTQQGERALEEKTKGAVPAARMGPELATPWHIPEPEQKGDKSRGEEWVGFGGGLGGLGCGGEVPQKETKRSNRGCGTRLGPCNLPKVKHGTWKKPKKFVEQQRITTRPSTKKHVRQEENKKELVGKYDVSCRGGRAPTTLTGFSSLQGKTGGGSGQKGPGESQGRTPPLGARVHAR